MASKYNYITTIYHDYLKEEKQIKANNQYELKQKIKAQKEKWNEKQDSLMMEEKADIKNKKAQKDILECQSILSSALIEKKFNWSELKNKSKYTDPYPKLDIIKNELDISNKSVWEYILPFLKRRREEKEDYALQIYNKNVENWNRKKEKYENKVNQYNKKIRKLKELYEEGDKKALVKFAETILNKSKYPTILNLDKVVDYDTREDILLVNMTVPNTEEVTKIKEFRYAPKKKVIEEKKMGEKEFKKFYDNLIKEICLRTVYELFSNDYNKSIKTIIFNGFIKSINKANGKEYTACILSLRIHRKQFEDIDFSRISADECIKDLKGCYSGNLTLLNPVRPILELNMEDPRFINSKSVLDKLDDSTNLATMDWKEFEHLVGELFTKYYENIGGVVKVTQASKDKGVDAVAFDPDPIRGGKTIIQAKRYNNVVPLSAIKELSATIGDEGASSGIMVTTSYFSSESKAYVEEKPIKLIDGQNLIHLFSEYGYNVNIKLVKKKKLN